MISNSASVIIVTYNHRKYMEDCLSSVLSNDPLEVIVVDNGSVDGTAEFVEEKLIPYRSTLKTQVML